MKSKFNGLIITSLILLVAYQDDAIAAHKVSVSLEAWSPKIPHQSKESALPVIFFDFSVTNTDIKSVEVIF